jgi:hypothetical protein
MCVFISLNIDIYVYIGDVSTGSSSGVYSLYDQQVHTYGCIYKHMYKCVYVSL